MMAVIVPSLVAEPLSPGETLTLSPSTNPDLGGVASHDGFAPFQIRNAGGGVILSGEIGNRVVKSSSLGTLIFAPRLRSLESPTGTARIVGLVCEGFADATTDVGYADPGSGTVAPNQVTRSPDVGDRLDFQYNPNTLAPPEESRFLQILTDARGFDFEGVCEIYAEDSPGGTVYSSRVAGMARPVAIRPGIHIVSFSRNQSGRFELSFEAEPGTGYRIHWGNTLTGWTDQFGAFPMTTPHTVEILPFEPASPTEFYRVVLPD